MAMRTNQAATRPNQAAMRPNQATMRPNEAIMRPYDDYPDRLDLLLPDIKGLLRVR